MFEDIMESPATAAILLLILFTLFMNCSGCGHQMTNQDIARQDLATMKVSVSDKRLTATAPRHPVIYHAVSSSRDAESHCAKIGGTLKLNPMPNLLGFWCLIK